MERLYYDIPTSELDGSTEALPTGHGLPELVAPRYFAGQLLTDRDLTVLLDYTRERLGLDRYRDGWGVACGLGVGLDASSSERVIVGPGYALGPRGDDLVLRKAVPVDLGESCRDATPAEDSVEAVWVGGQAIPRCDLRAVDLYIRARRVPFDPQPGLDSCSEREPCHDARTLETVAFEAVPGRVHGDPQRAAARRWRRRWMETWAVVWAFRKTFRGCWPPCSDCLPGDKVKRWFLDWIAGHPLFQLAWIADRIECLPARDFDETVSSQFLFWLVQDARLRLVSQTDACRSCGGAEAEGFESGIEELCFGVPLARIWMRDDNEACSVIQIDTFPPYRRPLGLDVWPAPPGKVNLGQTIWMRWGEARDRLAALGVAVDKPEVIQLPRGFRDLVRKLRSRLFAAPDAAAPPVHPWLIEEGLGLPPDGRVVAFAPCGKPEEDDTDEELVPEEAAPGDAGTEQEPDGDGDRDPLADSTPGGFGRPGRPGGERPGPERPGPESPGGASSGPGGIET